LTNPGDVVSLKLVDGNKPTLEIFGPDDATKHALTAVYAFISSIKQSRHLASLPRPPMKDPLHTFFVERASKLVSNDDACVGISCALAVSAALGFDCDTTKRWVKLIAVALAAVKRRKLVLGIDIHTNFQSPVA
jgi:hypothetical protein